MSNRDAGGKFVPKNPGQAAAKEKKSKAASSASSTAALSAPPSPSTNPSPAAAEASVDVINIAGTLDDKGAAAAAAESPYGEPPAGASEEHINPEMAEAVIKMPFAMAAGYFGEHWTLSDFEAKSIATPAAKIFSRMAGRFAESNPDGFMLGLALCIVLGPRVITTVKISNQKKAAAAEAARMGAAGVPAAQKQHSDPNAHSTLPAPGPAFFLPKEGGI